MSEAQINPDRYTDAGLVKATCAKCGTPVRCRDVTWNLPMFIGNAFKYLWRLGAKGDPKEDLKKAINSLIIHYEHEYKEPFNLKTGE